jgi:capsular polysaccharide transport system permease protein
VEPIASRREGTSQTIREHANIIWALILRELATRYGRDNIGFIWLFGEPLLFFGFVLTMWSIIKPPYEHGIRLAPFLMTGYIPILMMRHMIGHTLMCVRANAGLLYHRRITIQHLFFSRLALEFIGVTLAFFVVFVVLAVYGVVPIPENVGLVYAGWFLLGWVTFGISLIIGALSELVEMMEKLVSALTYILVPISGMFFMAAWIPDQYRPVALLVPFLNCIEMIRGGFFGDFVTTYYSVAYVVAWGACTTFLGLILLTFLRSRVEVE